MCPQQSNCPMAMLQEFPVEKWPNLIFREKCILHALSALHVWERFGKKFKELSLHPQNESPYGKSHIILWERSQNLGSEIKNKLYLSKLGPKADFQVLEIPIIHTAAGHSLLPLFQSGVPQLWHHQHFGLDNPLLWGLSMHCRMVSSILDLWRPCPLSPVVRIRNFWRYCPMSGWDSQLKTTLLEHLSIISLIWALSLLTCRYSKARNYGSRKA